jgi:hypothetical protein
MLRESSCQAGLEPPLFRRTRSQPSLSPRTAGRVARRLRADERGAGDVPHIAPASAPRHVLTLASTPMPKERHSPPLPRSASALSRCVEHPCLSCGRRLTTPLAPPCSPLVRATFAARQLQALVRRPVFELPTCRRARSEGATRGAAPGGATRTNRRQVSKVCRLLESQGSTCAGKRSESHLMETGVGQNVDLESPRRLIAPTGRAQRRGRPPRRP